MMCLAMKKMDFISDYACINYTIFREVISRSFPLQRIAN